jgi:hypothetical protein
MTTEIEIVRELKRVRELLAAYRANGDNEDMLYGAQQALVWVLGRGISPSELEQAIQEIAEDLTL